MMGAARGHQGKLFYAFDLDASVPEGHLLRRIDAVLDRSDLRDHVGPFYSHTGRPSIDPERLVRMLIVGYRFGIRSERRLCEEVSLNLAYRWFCRLGIEDPVPDHSTFTKNRSGRFRDSDLLRKIFEGVLRDCIGHGLVGGEGFAVDASIIQADASPINTFSSESMFTRMQEINGKVAFYLASLDPDEKPPKVLSRSGPQAGWVSPKGGRGFYAYAANYLVDLHAGVIVDTETTRSHRPAEVAASQTMIERTRDRFDLAPKRIAADTAYGTGPFLNWLVEDQQIAPHIPVWDKIGTPSKRISREEFAWNAAAEHYVCPEGKPLVARGKVMSDNTRNYLASATDCRTCPLKVRCCPGSPQRTVRRSIFERARDVARSLAKSPAYARSQDDRKKVEMSFAQLRRTLGIRRLRLRGLRNAADELMLGAIALNLRKMANHVA